MQIRDEMLDLVRAFDEARLAALHIDLQAGTYDAKFISAKVNKYAENLRGLSVPNYWVAYTYAYAMTTHEEFFNDNDEDHRIHPDIHIPQNEIVLQKRALSAFKDNACLLDDRLNNDNICTLLIGGIIAKSCVKETIKDALIKGFYVYFVIDLTDVKNDSRETFKSWLINFLKEGDLPTETIDKLVFTTSDEVTSTLEYSGFNSGIDQSLRMDKR